MSRASDKNRRRFKTAFGATRRVEMVTAAPSITSAKLRPAFTVVKTTGGRFDANHVAYTRLGNLWAITFQCSGTQVTFPIEDVAAVEFDAEGASWCGACDGGIVRPPDTGG